MTTQIMSPSRNRSMISFQTSIAFLIYKTPLAILGAKELIIHEWTKFVTMIPSQEIENVFFGDFDGTINKLEFVLQG